jgi:hypothetical protein
MKTKQLQLVTFIQAKKLKELGFDWETDSLYFSDDKSLSDDYGLYNHNATVNDGEWTCEVFSAPTISLALKWFRDEKNTMSHIVDLEILDSEFPARYNFQIKGYESYPGYYDTYEDAESALLDELLTICEG